MSEGPTDGGGLFDFVFKKDSSKNSGTMACADVVGACVEDTGGVREYCDGGDYSWYPVSVCTFAFKLAAGV